MKQTGYLAALGFVEPLKNELKNIIAQYGRLLIASGEEQKVYWAQNIWQDPKTIAFDSISDGAKKLRDLHGLWAYYPYENIRRGKLISERLPYFSPKPLGFLSPSPSAPLGSWTLIDSKTIVASPQCKSPFSHGEVQFAESKFPPSRAYLKLWELFSRIGKWPKAGDRCLEIGASPGSWTWVLSELGSHVTAVDRALLSVEIIRLPNVSFQKKDAFSVLPASDLSFDWIFSDVICYPEKLLGWVQKWWESNPSTQFVCTIKFQGSHEYGMIRKFEQFPQSQIIHLHHNKHELTWYKINQ